MCQEKVNDKPTIVIIDDNEIDLMIATKLFYRVNPAICVFSFTTGKEAIAWLEKKEKCTMSEKMIFLIDIYMPTGNGFQVAKSITQIFKELNSSLQCYLLSSSIDYSDKRRIDNQPLISGFCGKPITVEWIKTLLEEM
ncbi:MAG: response regulator [Salibacteraceae bacterium]